MSLQADSVGSAPKVLPDTGRIVKVAHLIRNTRAPLVVIGKGAAYSRAENAIRTMISRTKLFFLPTPMGKGVMPDSHPTNTASARSTALKEADVVLLLGARLNWILHFGDPPKWHPNARFIQIDISAEGIGCNGGDESLGIVGDIAAVVPQLTQALGTWSFNLHSPFAVTMAAAKRKSEDVALAKAASSGVPLSYAHGTLRSLSPPDQGSVVYVSEGANTMDIPRSIFPVSHPRLRLDAGTYATMGVGLGYAIAAYVAYKWSHPGRSERNSRTQEGCGAGGRLGVWLQCTRNRDHGPLPDGRAHLRDE